MILIFETHPIQYKAPIYQRLQQLRPGYVPRDLRHRRLDAGRLRQAEFGRKVTWDAPLLDGYPNTVLKQPEGRRAGQDSAACRGQRHLTSSCCKSRERPQRRPGRAVPFRVRRASVFLACATLLRIPIWIRVETQDEAFVRTRVEGRRAQRVLLAPPTSSSRTPSYIGLRSTANTCWSYGFKPKR